MSDGFHTIGEWHKTDVAGFAFVYKGQLDEMKILPAARSVLDHHFATVSQ